MFDPPDYFGKDPIDRSINLSSFGSAPVQMFNISLFDKATYKKLYPYHKLHVIGTEDGIVVVNHLGHTVKEFLF